jgi:hypothetical protein
MPFEHASVAASGNDPRPFALTSFLSTTPRSDSWHRIGRNFASRLYPHLPRGGSRSMFVFPVSRPFVCGCHNISTIPSVRTIPGLPGSHTLLPHRVARTHLGTMGWNPNAFASIVQARPFPIFGRPVHPRDGSLRLRPGGSPQALRTPPRDGRPALRSCHQLQPVRRYPHLLNIDSGPRVEWDFNPPETCAARHTLQAAPPLCLASVLSSLWGLHLDFSLHIETTGSHVPCKSLAQSHAIFTPEAA